MNHSQMDKNAVSPITTNSMRRFLHVSTGATVSEQGQWLATEQKEDSLYGLLHSRLRWVAYADEAS